MLVVDLNNLYINSNSAGEPEYLRNDSEIGDVALVAPQLPPSTDVCSAIREEDQARERVG
jgi:hypothetical protein